MEAKLSQVCSAIEAQLKLEASRKDKKLIGIENEVLDGSVDGEPPVMVEENSKFEIIYPFESYESFSRTIINDLSTAIDAIDAIKSEEGNIGAQTKSLFENCQKMLADQSVLEEKVEKFGKPLEVLKQLDRISKRLGVKIQTPLSDVL